jgi:hypothetical protein
MRTLTSAIVLLTALSIPGCARSTRRDVPNTSQMYLDLLKLSLTDMLYEQDPRLRAMRVDGGDQPSRALTMIGLKRLDNLQFAMEDALARGVPGDFAETGAWRGGACIFMRGVLKAHGITDRTVWAADSFEGLPPPDPKKYPADADVDPSAAGLLAVSLESVQASFARFGLLDGQVKFLKGWFRDTLPSAPIRALAVLRLDGDYYESTMDGLVNLYPKVSSGGYVIVDDYGSTPGCAKAVDEFRAKRGIAEPMVKIDWTGTYWRKR